MSSPSLPARPSTAALVFVGLLTSAPTFAMDIDILSKSNLTPRLPRRLPARRRR